VVSVLDSGAEGPGFKSQPQRCRVTVWGKLFTNTHCASVHQVAKLVAALLRGLGVTAGLAESNGSLPPSLWLTSLAGWLPSTGISSGTIRSAIEYGLPLPLVWLKVNLNQPAFAHTSNWYCTELTDGTVLLTYLKLHVWISVFRSAMRTSAVLWWVCIYESMLLRSVFQAVMGN